MVLLILLRNSEKYDSEYFGKVMWDDDDDVVLVYGIEFLNFNE